MSKLKLVKKIKRYLLYGVAFSFVLTVSSYINNRLNSSSKSLPTVSKKIQLPPIIPTASADDPHDPDGSDGTDTCDTL